ncbi:uncharacterized protein LOC134147353 isoform X2 [Rhea pennata]|uniref:uncharacterized protein LOC134147353 isoform X2 n=1 Tax=Rhea pennata TaxID=8795 RepID=UPI002E263D46
MRKGGNQNMNNLSSSLDNTFRPIFFLSCSPKLSPFFLRYHFQRVFRPSRAGAPAWKAARPRQHGAAAGELHHEVRAVPPGTPAAFACGSPWGTARHVPMLLSGDSVSAALCSFWPCLRHQKYSTLASFSVFLILRNTWDCTVPVAEEFMECIYTTPFAILVPVNEVCLSLIDKNPSTRGGITQDTACFLFVLLGKSVFPSPVLWTASPKKEFDVWC